MVRDVTERAAGLFCEDFEGVVERLEAVDRLLFSRAENDGVEESEGEEEREEREEEGEEEEDGDEREGKDGAGKVRLRAMYPRTGAEIRVLLS